MKEICFPSMGIEEQRLLAFNKLRESNASVVTEGLVVVGARTFKLRSVLHDTGASDNNYIDPAIASKLKPILLPGQIRHIKGGVMLGDGVTQRKIEEELVLMVRFWDPGGLAHQAELVFQVFKTGHDMIVGYPAIVDHFLDLMIALLRDGKAQREAVKLVDSFSFLLDVGDRAPVPSDLVPAWSQPLDPAEEESDIYEPVQFESALYFLSVSHEEAYNDFLKLLDTHIAPEFAEAVNVKLLLCKKYLKVWIPDNWEGIKGIPPLELRWIESALVGVRNVPKPRPINPRLFENASKEFERLRRYHYVPSTSPIASPLVIAPKATSPYIRFCGDYNKVNKVIETHHGFIPVVEHEIQKIKGFKIFLDIDMANAFHQFLLGPVTSERLSIVTPWGQYKPVFMPEGVAPASIVLQDVMREIFSDYSDWAVIIFDNILLLAKDYEDAYSKLDLFLARCLERNIVLKMAKSFLGFKEVKFFGYNIRFDSYELGEDRKEIIERIPFPRTVKDTQSFLGVGIFFQRFVPSYATVVAPLYEMTKQNFDWDKNSWKIDYEAIFEEAKRTIVASMRLYFPDYSLRWLVRTDASLFGVGGVLMQIFIGADGVEILQPIAFVSKKFSESAAKWATIQQECYGIYYTLHKLQFYLRGKFFELETDHANLQWMEASENPLIVRMRVFVQGLVQVIRHISGSQNKVADFLSRTEFKVSQEINMLNRLFYSDQLIEVQRLLEFHNIEDCRARVLSLLQLATFKEQITDHSEAVEKINATCKAVHNARVGHMGARRTWKMLNEEFPGHGISFAVVEDFIMSCPVCQKDRLRMANTIKPIYRTIKQEHLRRAIGIDNVSITPADEDRNCGATIIVNLFSGLVDIFPYTVLNAENTSIAIFQYICNHGLVDEIHSDPGSDLTSGLIEKLGKYLGLKHVFSLVDRHESNGVERVIQEVLRHLKALVYEERLISKWSKSTVLPIVKYILNNSSLSERGGYTANQLTYGTADQSYYLLRKLVESEDNKSSWPELIRELDENLAMVREISLKYQKKLVTERSGVSDAYPNSFQKGDFITQIIRGMREAKLLPRYRGPFEVMKQIKNDIECKHLATGEYVTLDVEKVQLFAGTREEALEAANWDADQFKVQEIRAHKGEPEFRKSMEFLVLFSDGDELWISFSTSANNISKTVAYEMYCRSKPELYILVLTEAQARKHISEINKRNITTLQPGDIFYLDLRAYGSEWYQSLKLPEADFSIYVTECYVETWGSHHKSLEIKDKTLGKEFIFKNYDIVSYAYRRNLENGEILIDEDLLRRYPQIKRRRAAS